MPSLAYTPTHTPVVKLIVTFLVLVILKIIYKYEQGGYVRPLWSEIG